MVKAIPAKVYKSNCGFRTKKAALLFAKKNKRIKPNYKIRNTRKRHKDYVKKLKGSLEMKLTDDVIREIKESEMYDELIKDQKMFIYFFPTGHEINYRIKGKIIPKNKRFKLYYSGHLLYNLLKDMPRIAGAPILIHLHLERLRTDPFGAQDLLREDVYWVLNDTLLKKLKENSENIYVREKIRDRNGNLIGGDFYIAEWNRKEVKYMEISYRKKEERNYERREGGFFKYFLDDKLLDAFDPKALEELERYQIFRESDVNKIEKINKADNCFIHSLNLAGVEKTILDDLRVRCRSSHISLKDAKEFAKKHNLFISITCESRTLILHNNGNKESRINLCYLDNHYFINEKTKITRNSIKNYEEYKKLGKKNINEIDKISTKNNLRYPNRDKKRTMTSFNLIKELLKTLNEKKSLLIPIKLNEETLKMYNINEIMGEDLELKVTDEDCKEEKSKKTRKEHIRELEEKEDIKKILKKYNIKTKDIQKDILVFFDFETNTNYQNTGKHKPYMVSYNVMINNKDYISTKTIHGDGCELEFLLEIKKIHNKILEDTTKIIQNKKDKNYKKVLDTIKKFFKLTIMAHNVTYDIKFILSLPNIYRDNLVERGGNKICGGSFWFEGVEFQIRDSLAIIDCKLSKFSEFFNIKTEKEIIPYGLYNIEKYTKCINRKYAKIGEAIDIIRDEYTLINGTENPEKLEELIKHFKTNIRKWGLKKGKKRYDQLEYAKIYCERDVDLMKEGYCTFRKWVKKDFDMNLDDYLTISSLAHGYFIKEGCYEGCYKIGGIPRYFIQKSVVGGRCMSRKNKQYSLEIDLNDLDGVSLYPSSMTRIASELGGYVKGKPKVLTKKKKKMEFLKGVDAYYIEIELNIESLTKKRNFPLFSYKNSKGVRTFSNEMVEKTLNKNADEIIEIKHNRVIIDKVALEDLMNFHELTEDDFSIISGLYFNDGRNPKIGEVIQYVFNKRVKYKKKGNPIQNLYKLIMNSAYGKTIMKERENKSVTIKGKDKMLNYLVRNHNHIVSSTRIGESDRYIIKVRKPINNHFNMCHIGSEILSMSKRIMNEVMCTAEDNDIEIYYQDTDSMHIDNSRIDELADLFKEKYGRDLIGSNLGQFHCDFAPIFVDGKKLDAKGTQKTIILGKKAYMDVVVYQDGDKTYTRNHCRMKAIPENVLNKKAKNDYNGDHHKMYKKLYNGDSIEFDLLSCGVRFSSGKDYSISTTSNFKRVIEFSPEEKIDERLLEPFTNEEIDKIFDDFDEE